MRRPFTTMNDGGIRFVEKPEKNQWSQPHDAPQNAMVGGTGYGEIVGRKPSTKRRAQPTRANDGMCGPS